MELLQKEPITKDDYEEIQRLFPLLDYREQGVDRIIMGVLERLWLSKLIDFKPTQLDYDT